ncbi:heat shock 22 kDa protein, mitochondrial-like [Euphorbia lathyris]|uniref:heat shock 22 kDa protein, mitochondrial-like n=1 Tax=Euphorbia lathyris TaxID=212925 RepID=UPI00331431D8
MASSLALRRTTASALFPKLFNPLRSASSAPSLSRSFNTNAELTNFGPNDLGNVDVGRRSSDRSLSRRRDTSPSFFPLDAIDLFSPPRSLSQMFNMMDQMMDFPTRGGGVGLGGGRRGWDVKEDEKAVYIKMDMPGVSKEDVKVSVEKNTLIIKGEEAIENEEGESGRRFSSRLELPSDFYKIDEIKAEMKNGVLKVVVPKKMEDETRDVREVKVA